MRRFVLASSIVVVALVASVATASSAHADTTYPTWAQVQAAKASQAATQAEVSTITTLLNGLQSTADKDGEISIERAADYAKAEQLLQAATARANELDSQATAAAAKSTALRTESGALTEQLSHLGGSGLTASILLGGKHTSNLLYQLGAVAKLSDQAASLFKSAAEQSNVAHAVSEQATSARDARDKLATAAAASLAAAKAAEAAVDAQIAKQTAGEKVLVAELATLRNTTAALEQKYLQGQAAAAAYAQAASGSGSADGFAPPPGITSNPAAAQAYAAGAIGAYGWGGSQMQCLIRLWNQESGWRLDAYNTSSGAYGIPQSLPAQKMASAGPDWETNADTQINWGLGYIKRAYGSPCGAWAHEVSHNWY
jgi:hypothetical protein